MSRAWAIVLLLQGCLWISAADHVRRTDQDGDGVAQPEDCDDADPSRYPGAPEVPCDSIDNDCNPISADGPASLQTPISETEVKSATYDTITRALEGAHAGDTLLVCAGRWRERIVVTVPSLTVSGSSIPEATVFDGDGLGGPVFEIAAPDVTLKNLTVENGLGRDRESSGTWGGGVYAWDATGTLTLDHVIVSNNLADKGAGVAGPENGDLVVLTSTFRGNWATTSGGGMYVNRTADITNALFTTNRADESGGALALGLGAQAVLDATTEIRANTAPRGAGVVLDSNGSLTGGWIVENTADEAGGGVESRGGNLTDVKIEGNVSLGAGGGATIFAATVTRGTFLSNSALRGGGMHVSGNVDVFGTSFQKNEATDGDGGGVLVEAGLLSIASDGVGTAAVSPLFSENISVDGGGAIAARGGSLALTGGEITACVADLGGAIAIIDTGTCPSCEYSVTDTVVIGNGAIDDGGGIWTDRSVLLDGVVLDYNATYGEGGGLHASGTTAVLRITGVSGSSNYADAGGFAAFYTGGAPAPSTIDFATFTSNEVDDSGSAVFIASGSVVAANSLINNNDAGSGAAIDIEQYGDYRSDHVTYRENDSYDIEVESGDRCSVFDDAAVFDCSGDGTCTPLDACQ
jgi:predicted outer membrane repeat protein